jgi:hypothetical protein
LPSEQTGIKYKYEDIDILNKSNQKENTSRIPYEYKVGDLIILETPTYPVTNVYKNGTIRIQNERKRNCIRKSEYP